MMKKFFIILFFCSGILFSQNKIIIDGSISKKQLINDTINFSNGMLSSIYYENTKITSTIRNNKFKIETNLSYPQMYSISLNSEKDEILFRSGFYFIDTSTTNITLDSLYKTKINNGITNNEFEKEFKPFILNGVNETFEKYYFNSTDLFDIKLFEYIKTKTNSFVGLWFLIDRVNTYGYNELYEKTMNAFSEKMKKSRLWKTLQNDIKNTKIRNNKKFPEFDVKNINLKKEKIVLPDKADFILVDFWFSRCRPCITQILALKEIYNTYHNKGFEIISISTDRTSDIENWKKRIDSSQMNWNNYLDENALIATKEKIFSYPTNYLLDKNGIVIKKNISLEDLKKILEQKKTN